MRFLSRYLTILSAAIFVICLNGHAKAQDAEKAVLGIGEITSSIRGSDPFTFQNMLETQLIKTNKFRIIERNRMEDVLKEQGLSESSLVNSDVELGGIEGIDYILYGSITKLGSTGNSQSFGGFSTSSNKVEMSVDLRIVDVRTGEIRIANTVEEEVKAGSAISVRGFSTGDNDGNPIFDVQRQTAKAITNVIVTNLYPAKIAAVQSDGTVIVNYGDSIFSKGDLVKVFQVGEGFVDPDTGEVLGAEETELATFEISSTKAKYSKARQISGGEVIVGNIVRKVKGEAKGSKPRKNRVKL